MPKDKQKQKTQVAGTNSCSTLSKCSIVSKGYVEDAFLKLFAEDHFKFAVNRSPIINYGYYVRFRAIQYGFMKTLRSDKLNVIISLGSGFDTSPFRYPQHFFVEIDYPSVCKQKAKVIQKNGLLDNILLGDDESIHLKNSRYILIGADLRQSSEVCRVFQHTSVIALIREALCKSNKDGIHFVLFNECSLCYIEMELADQLLRHLVQNIEHKFGASFPLTITYLGYEMFNSKLCQNDFGVFLLQHFDSLGASILTFLNEEEIEDRFRNRLQFDQVKFINMKEFYRNILFKDEAERERVKAIEPFDEWEELDNVCASYCLTIATKFADYDIDYCSNWTTKQHQLESFNVDKCYPTISVFGHSTTYNTTKNCIQIFGGFGCDPTNNFTLNGDSHVKWVSSGHKRLNNVVELQLDNNCQTISELRLVRGIKPTDIIGRIHSRVVSLEEDRHFLSGGRASPSKIMENSMIKIIDQDHFEMQSYSELNQLSRGSNYEKINAYRHVFARFGAHSQKLIQFGGFQLEEQNSEVVYIFDIESTRWSSTKVRHLNTKRHSSAFTTFQEHSILINGGLGLDGKFLGSSDLELLDHRENTLHKLAIANYEFRLYSHGMRALTDHEIVFIGGIGHNHISNTVTRIDLRKMAVVSHRRLRCPDQTLLLHNFSCEFLQNGAKCCLVGGGGNCFSFGTHFNPVVLCTL